MDCGLALSRTAPLQLCSTPTDPRTARFNPLSSQACGSSGRRAQPAVEALGECQYQVGQCGDGCLRTFWPADVASSDRSQDHPTGNGRAGQEETAQQDSPAGAGLGREGRRTPPFSFEITTG